MLVIFDIDGTLIRSTHIDDECFCIAMERVLGLRGFDTDWANYEYSTDDGLILEIGRRYGGFEASPRQIDDAKGEFFRELRRAVAACATSPCTQIEGVAAMLETVRRREGWRVGISSGTSEEAARIKLGAAGLSLDGLPATFSHRCAKTQRPVMRAEIIARTREKLLGGSGSMRAVYVGDGLWDLRAAKELGMGFVGVRHDGEESKLRGEGAERIVRDYRDVGAFVEMVEASGGEK